MGVIVRNGNAYGGFDKDFTVVDNLESVENIQKEHLYAVKNKLYYHDGENWIEFNPDIEIPEIPEVKTINADNKMIVSGDGQGWAVGSPFYVKSFTFPSNYGWRKYQNKSVSILEGMGDMVAISKKSDTNDLNTPILAVSEGAKVFFEESTDIDISGESKIYIHQNPVINIDGTPRILIHNSPTFYFEDFAHLKLDDYAYVSIENSSYFNMTGTAQSSGVGAAAPSPYFTMTNAAAFIMQTKSEKGPVLEADENQLLFMGKGCTGHTTDLIRNKPSYGAGLSLNFPLEAGNFERVEQPALRIGSGAQVEFADKGEGSLKFKACTNEGAAALITIDPDSFSTLTLKISPKRRGIANYLLEGENIFCKIDNNAHIENLNDSIFIMKQTIPSVNTWDQSTYGLDISLTTSTNYTETPIEISDFLKTKDGLTFLDEIKFKNRSVGRDPRYLSGGEISSVDYYTNKWETTLGGVNYNNLSYSGYLKNATPTTVAAFQSSAVFQNFISSNYGTDAIGTVKTYSRSSSANRYGEYYVSFSYSVENAILKGNLYSQTPELSENLSYNNLTTQNKAVFTLTGRDLSNAYVKSYKLRSDMLYTTTIKNYKITIYHLGKAWDSLIDKNYQNSSPIFQTYNASNFIMKGRALSGKIAEKASGSPLVEFSDDAEVRIGGGTKITTSYTENHDLVINFADTDKDVEVSFTIEELKKLKDLIKGE